MSTANWIEYFLEGATVVLAAAVFLGFICVQAKCFHPIIKRINNCSIRLGGLLLFCRCAYICI